MRKNYRFIPRVLIDFDGVLTHYTKWEGESIINDRPNLDMVKVLKELKILGYEIVIFSTRAKGIEGRNAMMKYCNKNDFVFDRITDKKEPAKVLIDDRCICFNGDTKDLVEKIKNFKPYYK